MRLMWLFIAAATMIFNGESLLAGSKTKVIAHRGHWRVEGSAQNSIKSLEMAQEAGAYGCEFDVNMTSDGVLVVCHGPKVGKILDIQKATYDKASEVRLENGEKLPTLEEFLKAALEYDKVRLVLEIKPASEESEPEVLEKSLALVKKYGLEDRLIIISFSLNVCTLAAKAEPDIPVQYLNGDKRPSELHELGIDGIDYHHSVLLRNKDLIKEAHDLGMEVNAWTVDDLSKMKELAELGVDYITTNEPVKAKEVL